MAKASGSKTSGGMKNFEERLERLEDLGEKIRKPDIPLDEALKAFEEGIKLARTLEKDLERVESRIEVLMNDSDAPADDGPELELFDHD
jgi:exodeoxyribonuclease VII small subunit